MLNEKYQQVLEKVVQRLHANYPELVAVYLAGSILRGEAGPNSDLDLWCIANLDHRVRHTWLQDGVLVEIFLNPYQQNLQYIVEDDFIAMHMLKTGQLIYGDPADPVLTRLVEMAKVEHEAGPEPYSEFALQFNRYMALDEYEDALDVADDQVQCRWVGLSVLKKALDFYYHYHGKWEVKPKRVLNHLEGWNPELAEQIGHYIMTGELALLQVILDEIYRPCGGMQRFEFSSAPDYAIPLPETEIVLIRHGWPVREKNVHPDEWVLDYTAYLDLAQYLDHPHMQEIERIYTSPQLKATQTASFYFSQIAKCSDVRKMPDLTEADRSPQYYENYAEVVQAYLTGERTESGWEELAHLQKRVLDAVKTIAKEARKERKRRVALIGHGLFFIVLKQQVCQLSAEQILAHWQAIPFGPYARLQINAFDEITWLGEMTPKMEEI